MSKLYFVVQTPFQNLCIQKKAFQVIENTLTPFQRQELYYQNVARYDTREAI